MFLRNSDKSSPRRGGSKAWTQLSAPACLVWLPAPKWQVNCWPLSHTHRYTSETQLTTVFYVNPPSVSCLIKSEFYKINIFFFFFWGGGGICICGKLIQLSFQRHIFMGLYWKTNIPQSTNN